MTFQCSRKILYALLFINIHSHAMNEQLSINDGAYEEQEEIRPGCCSRVWQRMSSMWHCSPETRTAVKQTVVLGGLMHAAAAGIYFGQWPENPVAVAVVPLIVSVPYALAMYRYAMPMSRSKYVKNAFIVGGHLGTWVGSGISVAHGWNKDYPQVSLLCSLVYGTTGSILGCVAYKCLETEEQQQPAQEPADPAQAIA